MSLTVALPHRTYLPPPSPLARRLMQSGNQPVSTEELVRLIELDPGLTVRILKVVNSPFYGVSRQVASVREALIFLGEQSVRRLAMGGAVAVPLSQLGLSPALVDAVWTHSVEVACLASRLLAGQDTAAPAFTAGLLQDIGQLELALREGPNDPSVSFEPVSRGACIDVSARLMRHWQLPEAIVKAVEFSMTEAPPADLLQQAVWLANRLLLDGATACLALGAASVFIDDLDGALQDSSREVASLKALMPA